MINANIKGNQNTTILLNQLKSSAKQYPCLTKDDEKKLIQKYKNNREELNRLLFMHNIRLVFNQAKRFTTKVNDFDNLVQDGMVGLAEAVKRFDITRDVKFCTYCMPWVRKYLLMHFYGKQIEVDKMTMSLNSANAIADDVNDPDTSFENIVNQYVDPSCVKEITVDSEISAHEQNDICNQLYQRIDNDNSLSAVDKAVFVGMFKNHEKTRDLAEKFHIDMEDVAEIKHRILKKLKNIMVNDFNITSYAEIGE